MKRAGILCLFVCFLLSCTTINTQFADIERQAAASRYANALEQLEKEKGDLYKKTDRVLYLLDSGLLAHYAQDFPQSNTQLSNAEKLIYEYYAKSITQAIGSAILNDTIIDYAGEDYEDVYANVFMALNYIHLNDIEDAFVEIRRFDTKLKGLAVKYQAQILQAQKEAQQTETPSYEVQFTNSAFARYLSMLLYLSEGNISSAEVDVKFIKSAFQTQPQLYTFPLPDALNKDLVCPPGKVRLDVLSFAGLSPVKAAETLRLPFEGTYFKIQLPVMLKRPSAVSYIRVAVHGGPENMEFSAAMEQIESIENIVLDTFKQRQSLIYFKTFARATTKAAASGVFNHLANEQSDSGMSALFGLLDLGSRFFTEASEQADTRISRFFPAKVYALAVTLDPGVYSVTVQYLDAKHNVLFADERHNVSVEADKTLNVLESFFLR